MKSRVFAPTLLRAWLLALLLLAAQAAGLAHRIAHVPGQGGGQARAAAAWEPGHQQGTPDCRLIDQLAHADALCAPAAWAPTPSAAATVTTRLPPQSLPARPAAAYLARAPPRA